MQRSVLVDITKCLLDSEASPVQTRDAVNTLHAEFSRITGMGERQAEDQRQSLLAHGKAICPEDAGRCILDFDRTAKFMRGIVDAIRELQSRFPDERLQVCYAGCGPFAPFALVIASLFSPDRVQFHLIDIHKRSLEAVEKLVEILDLADYIADLIQDDAASHSSTRPFHLLIVEAMQRALEKEPQLAITANLAPQLVERGILIPQTVTLSAYLADPRYEFGYPDNQELRIQTDSGIEPCRRRFALGTLVELNAHRIEGLWEKAARKDGEASEELHLSTLRVPNHAPSSDPLMVTTHISVYGAHILGDYDSGLTNPKWFYDFDRWSGGEVLAFSYLLGPTPEIVCRRLASH